MAAVAAGVTVILLIAYSPALAALANGVSARQHAEAALDDGLSGDVRSAREQIEKTQEAVADMRRATQGVSGWVWDRLPGAASDRQDMARVADALGHLAAAIEAGVGSLPDDGRGGLVAEGGRINLPALEAMLGETRLIEAEAQAALAELELLDPDSLLLGTGVAATREMTENRVRPLVRAIDGLRPILPHLPEMLGAEGPRGYVIALLNPAEQRYSGGAALTFAPLRLDDGAVSSGAVVAATGGVGALREVRWEPVPDNPFHRAGAPMRLTKATLAPSWSTSGEELLRGWEAAVGPRLDGVIALDVTALQSLMRYTGAIDVPGYGRLDSDNLTERLVGSYDELTSPEVLEARRAGNAQLVAEFRERLLQPTGAIPKLESVLAAGRGRHIAVYDRDPDIRRAVAQLGLSGDLADGDGDYLGVFNQAATGHKADYWQRRDVRSDVHVNRDGSARVELRIEVENDSPPPATDVDPLFANYVRRTNDMSLATFLPRGAQLRTVTLDGEPVDTERGQFDDRPYVQARLLLEPQETRVLRLEYRVPRAAEATGDKLVYRLDVDPHALVNPQSLRVDVHWPEGYATTFLPPSWSTGPRGVSTFETDGLNSSPRWGLVANR